MVISTIINKYINQLKVLLTILFICSIVNSQSIAKDLLYNTTYNFTQEEVNYLNENRELKILNNSNLPPYTYLENNKFHGYWIDLLEVMFKDINIKLSYDSRDRSLGYANYLNTGKAHILTSLLITEKRQKEMLFSQPILRIGYPVIIMRTGKLPIEGIKSLGNNRVALVEDHPFHKKLQKQVTSINFIAVENIPEALESIAYGLADITFSDLAMATYWSKKNQIPNLNFIGPAVLDGMKNQTSAFSVSKDNLILQSILNKLLKYTKESEITKLQKKWFLTSIDSILTKNSLHLNNLEKQYLKEKKTVKMCVDPNWLPFERIDENGKYIGILSEYIKYFSSKINLDFELQITKSYKQSRVYLLNEKCDIMAGDDLTTYNDNSVLSTKSYFTTQRSFAIHKDTKGVNDFSQIAYEGKIGILVNSPAESLLKQKFKGIDLVLYKSSKDGLNALSTKKIIAYVEPISSISYNIQNNGLSNIMIGGIFKSDVKLSVILNKNEKTLQSILNKVIENISEKEKVGILNKWVQVTYKNGIDYTLLLQILLIFSIIIFIIFIAYLKQNKLKKKIEYLNIGLEKKIKEEVEKNKKHQLMMFQQSRLAQMGEMISMIAHQWRQPLNLLSMLNQTVILKYKENQLDDKLIDYFSKGTIKHIKGMSQTIDDFSDFFKPEKEQVLFSVSNTILSTVEKIKPIYDKNNISINCKLDENIELLGYPNELGQALINIINNAKDALIENGIEQKEIKIVSKKIDNTVKIIINDNAGGIPNSIIDSIYDPYFSTKDEKNGTGIGLYMTKMIIEEHMNGSINVLNSNVGAIFTINLQT